MPSSNQRPPQQPPRQTQEVDRRQPAHPAERANTINPFDVLKADLERNEAVFRALIGRNVEADDRRVEAFKMSCYEHVWHKPELLEADRDSLLLAFAEAAITGLDINPTAKEGYIEVRSGIARFASQYQGLIKLMHRGTPIDFIFADVVRRCDFWKQVGGSTPHLEHVAVELGKEPDGYDDDAAILASYAVVKTHGSTLAVHEVARRREIDKAMAMSKGRGGKPPSPAWAAWYSRMARKLPLRRLANTIPGADDARMLLSVEDQRERSDRLVMLPGVEEVFGNHTPRGRTKVGPSNADRLTALMAASGAAGDQLDAATSSDGEPDTREGGK